MPGPNSKITNREKAAIFALVFGIIDDWTEAYIAAEDKTIEEAKQLKFIASPVSKWRNSDKVKNTVKEFQKLIADRDAEERQKGREEAQNEMTFNQTEDNNESGEGNESFETKAKRNFSKPVDYSDPENRKRLYNEVIRKAKDDPKTQLDAAKMFEQIQKDDKQAAREQKQVRAYLPITCKECALYERAKLKLLSNKNKITKTETAETRPGKMTGGGVEWR